jgi:hypothetical protein
MSGDSRTLAYANVNYSAGRHDRGCIALARQLERVVGQHGIPLILLCCSELCNPERERTRVLGKTTYINCIGPAVIGMMK